ncbi:hypothetical protein [Streptomyces sp. TBY4]|uniref:hypothetical protein n=1 Tax=Streptomyces sp. TBY4 TaxID=2962030 RepID=UPI0020B7A13E|nr:hypothetical protein [Streptomyces sp. TBY4]MCP3757215.1 hypothetical protein [Streptomyces sp. TBY4]
MRVRYTPRTRAGRAVLAVVAALAIGAAAAPLSSAVSGPDTQSAAARNDGPNDRLLRTPEAPRISDGPYAGFQVCGGGIKPVVTSVSPTLAATLESVAPPGTVEDGTETGPRRKVVFEVDAADGKPAVRKQLTSDNSHDAGFQLPEGKLTEGEYRWRMKVKDGSAVSEWTAWCDFTVKRA